MSTAESAVFSAEAAVRIAEAELNITEVRLGKSDIKAPFDAVIVKRSVAIGSYVRIGDSLFDLVSVDLYELEASVPSQFIPGLRVGKSVAFTTQDGKQAEASVRAVLPKQDSRIRNQVVRFTSTVPAGDFNFSDGQPVTIHLPIGDGRMVKTIHKDAILQKGGRSMAYAAIDGKATPITLALGAAIGDRLAINNDLEVGTLMVVRGNERLRPGQAIQFEAPQ